MAAVEDVAICLLIFDAFWLLPLSSSVPLRDKLSGPFLVFFMSCILAVCWGGRTICLPVGFAAILGLAGAG